MVRVVIRPGTTGGDLLTRNDHSSARSVHVKPAFPIVAAAILLAASACSSTDVTADSGVASAVDVEPTTTVAETTTTGISPTTAAATSTAVALVERPLPTTPVELANHLTEAERAIRDPELSDTDAAPWGRRLQRLYRVLTDNRDWAPEVIAGVGTDVRPDIELNWSARQDLSALVSSSSLSSTLPAWRIRNPLPTGELLAYYREAEAQTGVKWSVLASINLIETRMGRIIGLSTAGAIGPMQFLPSTWAECCEGDPAIDRDAIIGAAVYLNQRGAGTDLDRALFGYNNSDRYVRAVLAYAAVMDRNTLAYRGFHSFEVYFLSAAGLIAMPAGYDEPEPVDAAAWLADHPDSRVD